MALLFKLNSCLTHPRFININRDTTSIILDAIFSVDPCARTFLKSPFNTSTLLLSSLVTSFLIFFHHNLSSCNTSRVCNAEIYVHVHIYTYINSAQLQKWNRAFNFFLQIISHLLSSSLRTSTEDIFLAFLGLELLSKVPFVSGTV